VEAATAWGTAFVDQLTVTAAGVTLVEDPEHVYCPAVDDVTRSDACLGFEPEGDAEGAASQGFVMPADGFTSPLLGPVGVVFLLIPADADVTPRSRLASEQVLGDGRMLVYAEQFRGSDYDLMQLDLTVPKPTPTPIVKGDGSQESVDVSPDGRWVAYVSNESGNREVYVRPGSGASQQWQVSIAGGFRPRWTREGRELLFAAPNGDLMSTQVMAGPSFIATPPKPLFRLPEQPETERPIFEDVTTDGERLLLNVPTIPSSTYGFRIVLNWPGLLEQSDPR
jgi:hypothetical protein